MGRTIVAEIMVGRWTEQTDAQPYVYLNAALLTATRIARLCNMDILSLDSNHLRSPGEYASVVVYQNNDGLSLDEICDLIEPACSKNPPAEWMMQDVEYMEDVLLCLVAVRGSDEEWEDS
jgi:hypothetical protein